MKNALFHLPAIAGTAIGLALLAASGGAAGILAGMLAGAGIALAVQGWATALAIGPFRDRRFLAYGVAMLGRLMALAATALVLIPRLDLSPAPVLFSLVGVWFAAAVLEPLLIEPRLRTTG